MIEEVRKGRDPEDALNSFPKAPTIEVETSPGLETDRPLKYRLSFTNVVSRVNIIAETIEKVNTQQGAKPYFYYTFQQGHPAINIRVRTPGRRAENRTLQWDDISLDQSVFCTAQGSGSLSGTLLAREVVPVNTDVPRVDVWPLQRTAPAATRRSSRTMATSRLE